MAITTYADFSANYLVYDGMVANATNFNLAPDQLKKELDETIINLSTNYLSSTSDDSASGLITLTNVTNSTLPTNGALVVAGGIGVAKDVNIGGDVTATTYYGDGSQLSGLGFQMLGNAATKAISYNAQSIAENIVIPANVNAFSAGDITISTGYTVTVDTTSVWKII